jgi:hypothetical protein
MIGHEDKQWNNENNHNLQEHMWCQPRPPCCMDGGPHLSPHWWQLHKQAKWSGTIKIDISSKCHMNRSVRHPVSSDWQKSLILKIWNLRTCSCQVQPWPNQTSCVLWKFGEKTFTMCSRLVCKFKLSSWWVSVTLILFHLPSTTSFKFSLLLLSMLVLKVGTVLGDTDTKQWQWCMATIIYNTDL